MAPKKANGGKKANVASDGAANQKAVMKRMPMDGKNRS